MTTQQPPVGGGYVSSSQILEITECPICTESFQEPKVLPCIHTFCLHCLEKYGEKKEPGDQANCPLCRKAFTVPRGGFRDLPNNFFVNQLLQLNQQTGGEPQPAETKHDVACELCSGATTSSSSSSSSSLSPPSQISASVFCVDCSQHLCEPCCGKHNNMKMAKGHQVVGLKDKPSSEALKRMASSYCEEHASDEIKFYCYDCKITSCVVCYVAKHNKHQCADVKESGKEFGATLKNDIQKVSGWISKRKEDVKEIAERRRRLGSNVESTEREIMEKFNELRSLLELHQNELIEELKKFQETVAKELETGKDEVERQLVILESFKRYGESMIERGSSSDISRSGQDLHARADELLKSQEEFNTGAQQLLAASPVDVFIAPSPKRTDGVENWIGKLTTKAAAGEETSIEITLSAALPPPQPVRPRLLQVIPGTTSVQVLAVVGNELFISRHGVPTIDVYDNRYFNLTHRLTIGPAAALNYSRMAACAILNVLYVSSYTCGSRTSTIHRVELLKGSNSKWNALGACEGLSVTRPNSDVLVTARSSRILEYTTHGALLREIILDVSIDNPRHCVQLPDGNFVICHQGLKQQRVCVVDSSGHILKSYGGTKGAGVSQLHGPMQLSVNRFSGVIHVADCYNDTVQLLDSELGYVGRIEVVGHDLKYPVTVHFQVTDQRLYVGEFNSGCVVVLDMKESLSKQK